MCPLFIPAVYFEILSVRRPCLSDKSVLHPLSNASGKLDQLRKLHWRTHLWKAARHRPHACIASCTSIMLRIIRIGSSLLASLVWAGRHKLEPAQVRVHFVESRLLVVCLRINLRERLPRKRTPPSFTELNNSCQLASNGPGTLTSSPADNHMIPNSGPFTRSLADTPCTA